MRQVGAQNEAEQVLRRWLVERVFTAFQGRVLPVDAMVAMENAAYHVPALRPLADSLIAAVRLAGTMAAARAAG